VKGRIALGFALLLTAGAMATTVIPMSVEELTRSASHIVEARALSARSEWNPQHSLIYTYTTFQVTRGLKGAVAQTITVKQLGGSAGGYTQKVSGVHHAPPGEEALLFLRPSEAGDGTYVVVGLAQGNFRVFRGSNGGTMVSNRIGGAHALAREGGPVTEFSGTAMTLGQAEARIQRAMQ
jgi:hypothetical protein